MRFVTLSSYDGNIGTFFQKEILKKVENLFNDDVDLYLNTSEKSTPPEEIMKKLKKYDNFNKNIYGKNKKKIIFSFYSWHTSNVYLKSTNSPDADKIPFENVIDFKQEKKLYEEVFIEFSNLTIGTYVKMSNGISIVYCGISLREGEPANIANIFSILIEGIIQKTRNTDIFKIEKIKFTEEKKDHTEKDEDDFFCTIDDAVCRYLTENQLSVNDICKEMISKIDYGSLIPMVNLWMKNPKYFSSNMKHNSIYKKNIEVWLKQWAINNYKLYILFNRSLIVNFEKSIQKDERTVSGQVENLKSLFSKYSSELSCFTNSEYLLNKIENIGKPHGDMGTIYKKINNSNYTVDSFSYTNPVLNEKLSSYFSRIFQDDKFNLEFSKIIQDNNMDVKLSFSIDPCDYFTMSVTKNKWRSCHNCFDGEKATGAISYMFDSSTVVAYLHSGKEVLYNFDKYSFRWNSKISRQLVHVNTRYNSMIFNRLYPAEYKNNEVTLFIRNSIENLIASFCKISNRWIVCENAARKRGRYEVMSPLPYDDIPHRKTDYVKHKLSDNVENRGGIKTYIGEKVICPSCNNETVKNNYVGLCNSCIRKGDSENDKISW